MKIGIIGNGFVGKATKIFGCKEIEYMVYDIIPELCQPLETNLIDIIEQCEIIFISVPTPMKKDGSCYLGILESVIKEINKIKNVKKLNVVIRSTIPPGTSTKLGCFFMPEFLTEKNFENDFVNNKNWIFGLSDLDENKKKEELFKKKIEKMINYAYKNKKIKYNNIIFMENNEAEAVKLFRNNFLTTKVSFCNEFFEFCNKLNINYENVRKIAVLDNRIGSSHTNVPGPDGKLGYGGTCFPKDINNTYAIMKGLNMESYIIKSVIERNEKKDRKDKDWNNNKGRAVINN